MGQNHPRQRLDSARRQLINALLKHTGAMLICVSSIAIARAANPIATFDTTLGSFQVELLNNLAPQTVANFLSYVDSGAYNDSFIHRTTTTSYDGLAVVQGGGYTLAGAPFNGANPPTHIDTSQQTPLPNEYSALAPNAIGTLAMALTGGATGPNADSGTSEWFFNVGDNSQILSPAAAQNGVGYAVFGQVLGDGMQVVDAIQQTERLEDYLGYPPQDAYQLGVFGPMPVLNFDPSTTTALAASNLIVINSVTVPRALGDANLDGVVNGLDIALVASHWGQTGSSALGDANHDHVVNGLDIALIASNWDHTLASGNSAAVAVPEPSILLHLVLGMTTLAATLLIRQRRRSATRGRPTCRAAALACALVLVGSSMARSARADNPIATFDTSLGSFQVELLNNLAPQTVANFLSYVDSGAYNDTFIHRVTTQSYDGLSVVQGGGYSAAGGPFNGANQPTHIDNSTQTVLPNEYSTQAPNAIGTLAMALTGGATGPNGDSGTSEWFFNVGDNSQILSPAAAQNGVGYAVFGQVLGDGMQIVDQIQQMQRVEDILGLSAQDAQQELGVFGPIPVSNFQATDQAINASSLVTISDITVPRVSGDANLDGRVDSLDIAQMVNHWTQRGSYVIGDTNNDHVVNALDIAVAVGHWGQTLDSGAGGAGGSAVGVQTPGVVSLNSAAATVTTVPEPSTVALLLLAVATLTARRLRRHR